MLKGEWDKLGIYLLLKKSGYTKESTTIPNIINCLWFSCSTAPSARAKINELIKVDIIRENGNTLYLGRKHKLYKINNSKLNNAISSNQWTNVFTDILKSDFKLLLRHI